MGRGATLEHLAGLTSFVDWNGSSLSFVSFDGDLSAHYQGRLELLSVNRAGAAHTKVDLRYYELVIASAGEPAFSRS